jgi:hypothetical protein
MFNSTIIKRHLHFSSNILERLLTINELKKGIAVNFQSWRGPTFLVFDYGIKLCTITSPMLIFLVLGQTRNFKNAFSAVITSMVSCMVMH